MKPKTDTAAIDSADTADGAARSDAGEICVPLKSLALPSEGTGDVSPAVGDEVDVQGTATVTRVEGDKAYLTIKTVNGEAVSADEGEPGEKSMDAEEGDLRNQAQAEDKKRVY